MFEIIPNWHPIFVHFTVALFSLAVGLFAATPFIKSPLKEQWQTVARWNLWFGAGLTIITGLAGLYAYNTVAHDTPSHAAMTEHRNWAIIAITLILTLASWSIVRVRRNQVLGTAFIAAMVIAGGVLASTAWYGGEVVYRYGLGVMSLPKAEGEGHAHENMPTKAGTNLQAAPPTTDESADMTDKRSAQDGHGLTTGITNDGAVAAGNHAKGHDVGNTQQNDHQDDGHTHDH